MRLIIPTNLKDIKILLAFFKQINDILKEQQKEIESLKKEIKNGNNK